MSAERPKHLVDEKDVYFPGDMMVYFFDKNDVAKGLSLTANEYGVAKKGPFTDMDKAVDFYSKELKSIDVKMIVNMKKPTKFVKTGDGTKDNKNKNFKQFEEVKKVAHYDGQLKVCVPWFSPEVEGSNRGFDKCDTCFIKNNIVQMRIKNPMFITTEVIKAKCTNQNYKLIEKNMKCVNPKPVEFKVDTTQSNLDLTNLCMEASRNNTDCRYGSNIGYFQYKNLRIGESSAQGNTYCYCCGSTGGDNVFEPTEKKGHYEFMAY